MHITNAALTALATRPVQSSTLKLEAPVAEQQLSGGRTHNHSTASNQNANTCPNMSAGTHHPPGAVQHLEAAAAGGRNAAHNGRLWSQLRAAVGIRPRVPLQQPRPSRVWVSAAKDSWHAPSTLTQAEVLEAWRCWRLRETSEKSGLAPARQLARWRGPAGAGSPPRPAPARQKCVQPIPKVPEKGSQGTNSASSPA